MRLFLARHGNTFNPDQIPLWVGANEDLPLVEKGIEQATKLAKYFKEKSIKPKAIYTSKLQRSFKFSSIIKNFLELPISVNIDDRLNEIDYGLWGGLSEQEIISRFGKDELQRWQEKSIWPQNANWGSDEVTVTNEIFDFVNYLKKSYSSDDTVLVVTSNGKLRYFLKLIKDEFEKRVEDKSFKMKTGAVSELIIADDVKVNLWNYNP